MKLGINIPALMFLSILNLLIGFLVLVISWIGIEILFDILSGIDTLSLFLSIFCLAPSLLISFLLPVQLALYQVISKSKPSKPVIIVSFIVSIISSCLVYLILLADAVSSI